MPSSKMSSEISSLIGFFSFRGRLSFFFFRLRLTFFFGRCLLNIFYQLFKVARARLFFENDLGSIDIKYVESERDRSLEG